MTKYIVEEILDKEIVELIDFILPNEGGFLAGGSFKEILERNTEFNKFEDNFKIRTAGKLNNGFLKDLDIFFNSSESFNEAVAKMKSEKDYSDCYETINSVGFSMSLPETKNRNGFAVSESIQLDLIRKNFGTVEEILDNFDFTVTQCALYKENGRFYAKYAETFREDFANNRLVYSSSPDLSAGVIERFLRYVKYGFTPSNETSRQCIVSFCKRFDSLKNVDVDELLRAPDFLIASRKALKEKPSSISPKFQKEILDNASEEQKISWLAFIYYLESYWSLESDNIQASYSSKYAAEHSIARLLEQFSLGLSESEVLSNVRKLLDSFGYFQHATIVSTYTVYKLLKFLKDNEESFDKALLDKFIKHFVSKRFVPQSKRHYITCVRCGGLLHNNACVCDKTKSWRSDNSIESILVDNEAEVVLLALIASKNNNDSLNDCLSFFVNIYEINLKAVPVLAEWHESLEEQAIDFSLPPALMFNLMITEE